MMSTVHAALLTLCVSIFSVGCGGGGGDDIDTDGDVSEAHGIGWLNVNISPVNSDQGDTAHVSISGEAFVSPDYAAHKCAGLCCLFCWYDNSYPGVDVIWRNETTGDTGRASSRYGTLTSFEHLWSSGKIPIVPGDNRLVIKAFDPGENWATESFLVSTAPDLKPPEVVATDPVDGAGFVDLHDPIVVWFSESIDTATVNGTSFKVNALDGGGLHGWINVSETGTSATFTATNFLANTRYTAALTEDITDISGKPLKEGYVWDFATGEADFEAPVVSSTTPEANSQGIPLIQNISATFNEPMDHSSISTTTFTVSDSSSQIVPGTVSIASSGTADTATFTPDELLQGSSLYTANLTSSVKDRAGNPLASDYTWSFTTAPPDITPPMVESVEPQSGEGCAPIGARVTVTFNEAMDTSSLNVSTFQLTDADNNPVSGDISNTSTSSTLSPYANFANGTGYRATLGTGIKDLSGNALSADYSWAFTTLSGFKGGWESLSSANSPSGRTGHSAVWSGSEMIIWGGGWNDVTNTGGRYHLLSDSWQPTSTTGASPSPRRGHSAVWTGSDMIIWGGVDGNDALHNSGFRYNPLTDNWQAISMEGAPSPRSYHVTVWTGTEMVIWGGTDGTQSLNNGARYDPSKDVWLPVSSAEAPQYHYGYGWGKAVWTGTEMVLLNRYNHNPDNGAMYDPVTDTWRSIATSGAPAYGVEVESLVWNGSEVIVWGRGYFSAYNPLTDVWRVLSLSCSPSFRLFSAVIWTGDEMILWGGSYSSSRFDTGGLYYPASESWSPTTLTSAPSPRSGHTAIWTGNELLIWGGVYGLDSGGKYTP